MTDQQSTISMPSKPQIVAEAVARYDTKASRSSVLALDTPTLCDLGLRLVDRNLTVRDAWKWLNAELGATEDEPAVPERNLRRYAENFRTIYELVHSEHAQRLARLSIENATDDYIDTMGQVGKARLVTLLAGKLCETTNIDTMTANQLNAAMAMVSARDVAKIKIAELELKTAEGSRREAKLEADLAKMKAQLEQMEAQNAKHKQAMESARKQLDEAAANPIDDGKLSPDKVLEILDAVMKGDA